MYKTQEFLQSGAQEVFDSSQIDALQNFVTTPPTREQGFIIPFFYTNGLMNTQFLSQLQEVGVVDKGDINTYLKQ